MSFSQSNPDENYEKINLEQESGINFLLDNSKLIMDDCQELLSDLKNLVPESVLSQKSTKLQTLYDNLMALLAYLATRKPVSDKKIEEIENTYNNLILEQESLAQVYFESRESQIPAEKKGHHKNENLHVSDGGEKFTTKPTDRYHEKKRVSKKIQVLGDEDLANIKIDIFIKEANVIPGKTKPTPLITSADSLSASIISGLEKRDPVNRSIFSPSFTAREKIRKEAEISSWSKYINREEIISLLGDDFSLKTFTRHFANRTTSIEQETVDVFERWLGETRANVFDYLKDMTLAEVDCLTKNENIKSILKTNNLKYETFLRWIDEYHSLNEMIEIKKSFLFGELVCLSVALKLANKQIKV